MKIIAYISRFLAGLTFMFSGFVKGVDPLGTAYKMEDYFIAYHWEFFIPLALILAIGLCTLEFMIGVMVFFNLRMKLGSWLLLLMMIFFTFVTLYDAIYTPVPDCGCFGDAIKLTNWQTFYKNLVLLTLAFFVFFYRNKFKSVLKPSMQWTATIVFGLLFAGFSSYCYMHLPLVDFTEWKIGHKLYADNPKPAEYYLTYKNKTSGVQKEFLSPNYPYDDSVWMAQNEFISQRVVDPNEYYGKNLVIIDTAQNNVTESIIRNQGYQLIINAYSLSSTNLNAFNEINTFCQQAAGKSIPTAVLVSAEPSEINKFALDNRLKLDFYTADDILLKTMVRSNPGIMLLKGGVIINKWHWRDLPDFEAFSRKYAL